MIDLPIEAQLLIEQLELALSPEVKAQFADGYKYAIYRDDPINFGRNILGESYYSDLEKLMLSVRDNIYTVAKSANAVGKSFVSSSIAIWYYKCFENSQVYTAAAPPEDNLKRVLWGEIGKKTSKHPELFVNDKIGVMSIGRTGNSFIVGVAIPTTGTSEDRVSKFSGKHSEHILFILDEGDAIPDEVYEGIETCISGGHARVLIMFNPKKESGEAYRLIRDGLANVIELSAFRHPNVVTGDEIHPGAVTRIQVVRRINKWSIPLASGTLPDGDCFEVPDFLVGVSVDDEKGSPYPPLLKGWRKVIDQRLNYMVLARYPSHGAQQLISRDWVQAARNRWDLYTAQYGHNVKAESHPLKDARPIGGLDVADEGEDSNSLCLNYGGFIDKLQKWQGVDQDETAERSAEFAHKCHTQVIHVDSDGVGAAVAPLLRKKKIKSNKIHFNERPETKPKDMKCVFGNRRDELWWLCREWLRQDMGSMLPPDELLLEELLAATYEERNGKLKVLDRKGFVKKIKRSPDSATSLILTFAPKPRSPRVYLIRHGE